jgi:hypothetical protein
MHSAIQDCLDLVLLLAIDQSCGWGWCRTSAWDGIWMRNRQFNHREHRVKAVEVGGEGKAICASADARFDDKGA